MTLKDIRISKDFRSMTFIGSEQILIDFVANYFDRPICGILTFEMQRFWFEMIETLEEIDEHIIKSPKYAIIDIGDLIHEKVKRAQEFIKFKKMGKIEEYYVKYGTKMENYDNFPVVGIFFIGKIGQ